MRSGKVAESDGYGSDGDGPQEMGREEMVSRGSGGPGDQDSVIII